MSGMKEIFFSFTFGLASLLAFAHTPQSIPREGPRMEPIAVNGISGDSRLSLNWGLEKIHAHAAWKKNRGSKDVVVAVIDTGCDIHHPELSSNIWVNPGESGLDENGNPKESNGIDDDGNGFVDDFHGWNFVSDSPDVMDEHGHGTHIAGIIGATGLEGMSPIGVAPHVSLMILKYYGSDRTGAANLKHTIAAIRYAVRMGADIINYSGGGVVRSQEEEDALRWASSKGVLVVAAAGNDGLNSDFYHFYPADYELPNVISVAAADRSGDLWPVSNYGRGTVTLAAPGRNIYSTLPNDQHGFMSGTSQATAFVTGVAALMLANQPELRGHPQQLIRELSEHSAPRRSLAGKVRSGALLDANLALTIGDLKLARTGAE